MQGTQRRTTSAPKNANAIFGGSAEYVALWFKQAGREEWFYWYLAILCAMVFIVALAMPDSRKTGHLRHDLALHPRGS